MSAKAHRFSTEVAAPSDNRPARTAPRAVEERASEQSEDHPAPNPEPARPKRDLVDEASLGSFPASDPPSRWAGKDEPPPTTNGE